MTNAATRADADYASWKQLTLWHTILKHALRCEEHACTEETERAAADKITEAFANMIGWASR